MRNISPRQHLQTQVQHYWVSQKTVSVSWHTPQSGDHTREPSSSLNQKGCCQTFCWQVKLHRLSGQNKLLGLLILHTSMMGS
ncbi:hypothetical protein I79_010072 [Cricetulus griseus]|uniref:Uncharacterized protein n=1 Tax=Cricetulus griseus TaxID=10029 RepID=G3HHH0_CRIGR|nr:hypothetical protein I79_010072 [Cricetulus griseus]